MSHRKSKPSKRARRTFTKEFKLEAVQMILDGHSVSSVSKNLGIGNRNLLYRCLRRFIILMALIPNPIEGRICFLFCGGVVTATGLCLHAVRSK